MMYGCLKTQYWLENVVFSWCLSYIQVLLEFYNLPAFLSDNIYQRLIWD